MTVASDLLPANQAPFETALIEAMTDLLPVQIRDAVNPAAAPAHFLPWLAVHDGVRLWFSDWPEARKRTVIANSLADNFRIGARNGVTRYLAYVDGTLVDTVAYPARFVVGRARIGRTPIGHGAFLARYLIRVLTAKPARAHVIGRTPMGSGRIKTPSREPLRRCLAALVAAKAPETEYRVDFGHKRQITLDDAVPLDGTYRIGQFVPRGKL